MELFTFQFKAMGGPCKICIYAESEKKALENVKLAKSEVFRLEKNYSRYRTDSILSKINSSAGSGKAVSLDDETLKLLNFADTVHQQSEGLFDITSGVLRSAWDFKQAKLPQQKKIDKLLPLIGWQKVKLKNNSIELPIKGMELDFGGYVKEYAADSAIAILKQQGVQHALVDLAGDICVTGLQANNKPWSIGIRNPNLPNQALAVIGLESGALASSGNYERYIELNNKRYCHILNPLTGWPVSGLASVSIKAEQCMIAGVLTTIAMLKEPAEAKLWLESVGCTYLAIDQSNQIFTFPRELSSSD